MPNMKTRAKKTQASWEKKYQDLKRVITAEDWDKHQENFTRLYITEGFELEKVREMMAESYRFFANEKQCKAIIKKWGLVKYLPKNKVNAMLDIQQMRARQGKKTEFRLGGQLITEERLERAKRRHRREEKGLSHPINDHDMVTTDESRMDIEYSTPEPMPSLLDRDFTPLHTHHSVNLSLPSQNLDAPLLPTPEESYIDKAGGVLPQPLPPPLPATLNPAMLSWEPITPNVNSSSSSMGKELYCIGIPCAPQVDYSTLVLGSTNIDDSNMKKCIKAEIDRYLPPEVYSLFEGAKAYSISAVRFRIKEFLAKESEKLVALMEEESLLRGLSWGPSKVTLTLELVKDKDMLEGDITRRYRAEQLVVLGWQREVRQNGLTLS